jgi:hypothetical protein
MNMQNVSDFNKINEAAYDFFKKTSQSWMEVVNKSFGKTSEAGSGAASWPLMDVMKRWLPLQNDALTINSQKEVLQKMISSCLEQQKLYSELTKSGFNCATKTMEVLRSGAQNQTDPIQTLKACQELASQYCQDYTAFIESEYGHLCQDFGVPESKQEKNVKVETAKTKA